MVYTLACPNRRSNHSIKTHEHPAHTHLGKVYIRDLVVLHQRALVCGACTGAAQVGVSLVPSSDSLFKRSRSHFLLVCLA